MKIISKTISYIKVSGMLIWRHLPKIALYTLAFYILIGIGIRAYYHFAPAENFV